MNQRLWCPFPATYGVWLASVTTAPLENLNLEVAVGLIDVENHTV